MSILRTAIPDNARRLIEGLTTVGITLPEEVDDALALLDRIEARKPALVELSALTEAYLAEDDDDALRLVALEHSTSQQRTAAWAEAKVRAGRRLRDAMTSTGDAIIKQLQDLAAAPIKALEGAAALDTLDTATLVRGRRAKDAELAASVQVHAANLSNLYGLRNKVTKGASYGEPSWGADCSRWRDPRKIDSILAHAGTAESYLRGIRAGAGLWFPLPHEAEAAALPIVREARDQHEAERAKGWGAGSYVS